MSQSIHNLDQNIDTVIVLPMKQELRELLKHISIVKKRDCEGLVVYVCEVGQKHVFIIKSGVGAKAVRKTFNKFFRHFQVSLIIFTGVAGAVDPQLKHKDILIPEHVKVHSQGEKGSFLNKLFSSAFSFTSWACVKKGGTLYQTNTIYHLKDKEALREMDPHARAIDMESWAAFEIAQKRQCTCWVLRVILDSGRFELPPFEMIYSQKGLLRYVHFAFQCLRRPLSLWHLLLLPSKFRASMRQLARILHVTLSSSFESIAS